MSCCNHFRDFLVLSSADLTRLTLVDAASGPAPVNKDNKNKTVSSRSCQPHTTVKHSRRPLFLLAKVGRGLFCFDLLFVWGVADFFLFFFLDVSLLFFFEFS